MPLPLLTSTPRGLYCPAGNFYVDPWQPVPRAIITHAHGDHARAGSERYLTVTPGERILQQRMGLSAHIDTLRYSERLSINGVTISFHPAGHVLGSSQVRIEHGGNVWVVSGDYKRADDPTCTPFEPVTCDTFITESTFGLPIYRWLPGSDIFADINQWWSRNREEGRASLVFAYALGKAQRLIAGIDHSIGPIFCHGTVESVNRSYRLSGVDLPETQYAGRGNAKQDWAGALIVAPPSAMGSPWLRRFGDASTAFASGWMQIRGARRRRVVDRGFVLSDHADWPALLDSIAATGARRILVTHGHVGPLVQRLREHGLESDPLQTEFVGEQDESDITAGEAEAVESDERPLLPVAEETGP